MKKILLLLALAIIGVSCISEDSESAKLNIKNIDPFLEKTAPVKEGYTTIIKADTMVICKTNVPLTYLFPKGAKETIEYVPSTKGYVNGGYDISQFTVCFEDTKDGDNDYNDFVCFITRVKTADWSNWLAPTTTLDVYVQPIAYGAGTNLKFGIRFPDGHIWMATDNIVRDFFKGKVGYINTEQVTYNDPDENVYHTGDKQHIMKYTYGPLTGAGGTLQRINPFIINENNDTLYAAIYDHSLEQNNYYNFISEKGYPLGIAITNSFFYPIEKVNIKDCYPSFTNWILGNRTTLNTSEYNYPLVFNRIQDIYFYNPESNLNWNK